MNIGLTGASGLIGRALIHKLVEDGNIIIAFSRHPDRGIEGATETRLLDLDTAPDLSGLDILIHLAGEPIFGLWTKAKKGRLRESRIDLSRHLVEAMRLSSERPGVFISASGISYYGDGGDALLDESAPKGRGFLSDLTQDWEGEVARAGELGIRVAMMRFGAVLALRGGMFPLVRRLFRLCLGGRLSTGHQWMSWVHIDDVVSLIREAVSNPQFSGPVNVTSPGPITNREFTNVLATALKRPAILPAPAFGLKLILRGLSEVALQSQRCEPAFAKAQNFEFAFRDIRSAVDDLLEKEKSTRR